MTRPLPIGSRPPVNSSLSSQRADSTSPATKTPAESGAAPVEKSEGKGGSPATAESKARNDQFQLKEKGAPDCTFTSAALTSGKNQTHISPGTLGNRAEAKEAGSSTTASLWGPKKTETGQGVDSQLSAKGGLLPGSMRSAQVPFNQTMVAMFEKNAGITDKFKFSGICFMLSLQWLELRQMGTGDQESLSKIKGGGNFHRLWGEFSTQHKQADGLKNEVRKELVAASHDVLRLQGELKRAPPDQHARINSELQLATERKDKVESQLNRMFVAGSEEPFERKSELGLPAEQLMRKMFSMDVKDTLKVSLSVSTKRMLGPDKQNWAEQCEKLGERVKTTAAPAMFEIGLYGKDGADGHSIALFVEPGGRYSLFDPNYGVFQGDGQAHSFDKDLAKLLEDKYPKMKEVVLSTLAVQ